MVAEIEYSVPYLGKRPNPSFLDTCRNRLCITDLGKHFTEQFNLLAVLAGVPLLVSLVLRVAYELLTLLSEQNSFLPEQLKSLLNSSSCDRAT